MVHRRTFKWSDLNYTVSVTWMGYFVDDANHKLLKKLLTNLSSWESIPFASCPTNVFTTP